MIRGNALEEFLRRGHKYKAIPLMEEKSRHGYLNQEGDDVVFMAIEVMEKLFEFHLFSKSRIYLAQNSR